MTPQKNDLTHLIERLEAFEERCGVRLEALFVVIHEDGCMFVNGELHAREGTKLKGSLNLEVVLYDEVGRVLVKKQEHFNGERFFGFEAFSIIVDGWERPNLKVSKIRVYPQQTRF